MTATSRTAAADAASSPEPLPVPWTPEKRFWIATIAAILFIKLFVLAIDHTPMCYLGDSGSYLLTAASGWWLPHDRSFFYGFTIRWLAVSTRSLTVLLAAQAISSAVAALACVYILRQCFGVRRWIAAAFGIACALEPLQLLYERYIMTEAFALGAFAVFAAISVDYLRRPDPWRLGLMQLAGLVTILFRVSFVPVIVVTTILLPLLGTIGRKEPASGGGWRRTALHMLLSVVLFLALHNGYKSFHAHSIQGQLPGATPAYNYENGLFLLTFVSPIVKPEDFPDPAKREAVFGYLPYELTDHRNRPHQRWQVGGLVKNIIDAYEDPLEANRVAGQTAWNAIRRDPVGETKLALTSFAEYWSLRRLKDNMRADRGDRELDPQFLELMRDHFDVDARQYPFISTPTNRYFFAAWPWYLVCLLVPVPALAAVVFSRPDRRRGALLLLAFAGVQWVTVVTLTAEPTVRFIHGLAWMNVLILGVLAGRLAEGRRPAGG